MLGTRLQGYVRIQHTARLAPRATRLTARTRGYGSSSYPYGTYMHP